MNQRFLSRRELLMRAGGRIASLAFAVHTAKMIRLGLTSTPHKTKKPEIKLPVPPAAPEMQTISASVQA